MNTSTIFIVGSIFIFLYFLFWVTNVHIDDRFDKLEKKIKELDKK